MCVFTDWSIQPRHLRRLVLDLFEGAAEKFNQTNYKFSPFKAFLRRAWIFAPANVRSALSVCAQKLIKFREKKNPSSNIVQHHNHEVKDVQMCVSRQHIDRRSVVFLNFSSANWKNYSTFMLMSFSLQIISKEIKFTVEISRDKQAAGNFEV